MAIIIMNEYGNYIAHNNGKLTKVHDILDAENFYTLEKAIAQCRHNPTKTRGCYVFDTVTRKICYRMKSKKKPNRKSYSKDVRKMIYDKADGHCELCGRKILFDDMTLDHIFPLAMCGADNVENLQCVCFADNQFKRNILPDEFNQRITDIFMYQMEKKYRKKLYWKLIHKALEKMI